MASANSSLIPVFESTINQQVVQTVDAREIHAFLESKRQFSNWITYQIEAFDFKQDVDFSTINNSDYSPPRKEYHVSLDMAKELAMVERNAKGKEARQYFIAIEKEYQKQQEAMTPAEFLVRQAQMMLDHERRVAAQERINQENSDRLKRVECKQQAFEDGVKYFTVIGYVGYKGLPAINMTQAQKLGKIAKRLSSDRGILTDKVRDPRFGNVGSYHESVLEDAYSLMLECDE